MVFSSLSFNYNWSTAKQMMVAKGTNQDRQVLIKTLNNLYDGQQTLLFSQGRAALAVAVGLSQSKYIGTNSFDCYVVEQAIKKAKAEPVFLDINQSVNSYQFGLKELMAAHRQQPKLKAIIVNSCFGLKTQIKPIERYCQRNNILIIENLAQSFNTNYVDGRQVGTVGQLVMLSFSRGKQIDVVNGGALVIRDPKLVPKELPLGKPTLGCRWSNRFYPTVVVSIRNLIGYDKIIGQAVHRFCKWAGLLQPNYGSTIQINHQLDANRAALINNQLIESLEERQQLAIQLMKAYKIKDGLGVQPALQLPVVAKSAWHKKIILEKIKKEGVHLDKNFYDKQVYPERFANVSHYLSGSCPRSEKINRRIINLPLNFTISPKIAKKIGSIINRYNQYSIKTPTDRQQWEQYLKQLSKPSLNLSWEFGQAAQKNGNLVIRKVVNDGQTKIGLFQAVFKKSKLGNYIEIADGPIWIQEPRYQSAFKLITELLLDIGQKLNVVLIRFQPFLIYNKDLNQQILKTGAKLSPVNINNQQITSVNLKKINQKAKKEVGPQIKKYNRLGFQFKSSDNPDYFRDLQQLLIKTSPKRFLDANMNLIAYQYQFLQDNGKIRFYRATNQDGEIVAISMVAIDDSIASRVLEVVDYSLDDSDEVVEIIQALIILESKKMGLKLYNIRQTVIDKMNNEQPAATLGQFKKDETNYMSTYDLIIKPARYHLTKSLERLVKR